MALMGAAKLPGTNARFSILIARSRQSAPGEMPPLGRLRFFAEAGRHARRRLNR